VVSWPDVIDGGFGEQVRQLQYDTFSEHFGNMSKTPQRWQHHLESRSFTPDFSVAAVDDASVVVGYVLGSTYTVGIGADELRSAHTDYIGVRRDRRLRGTAELLLRKIWLAALRRGFTAASLGTDIDNASKAHLLYRRLGYVAVQDSYAYRIDAKGRAK
jgi:ribosomal protein S18 acetylase RimI-like enzyme